MLAISVATEEEDFVFNILGGLIVELLNLVVEALPLCQGLVGLELSIRWIGAVDEAEVDGGLQSRVIMLNRFLFDRKVNTYVIESRGIGRGLILKEVSRQSGVLDH